MFSAFGKYVDMYLAPPGGAVTLVALAALGLWTPWPRFFRVVASVAALALVVCAYSPLCSIILRPLEDRFPRPVLTQAPTGILVLGGVTDESVTVGRDAVALEDGAERLTESFVLARKYPQARLAFAGGSGRLAPVVMTEAAVAKRFWTELGLPAERLELEDRSRDTWENAVNAKALLKPKDGEVWLLVTSAAHMPRSMGIFRRVGFPVVAYPVDYRTAGDRGDFRGLRRPGDAFLDLSVAMHEWIGLVAYWLNDKTTALFPAP